MGPEIEAAGADALLVVTPAYNKPAQAGLDVHFEQCCAVLCHLLYNVLDTGVDLKPETIYGLADVPNIVAIEATVTWSAPRRSDA